MHRLQQYEHSSDSSDGALASNKDELLAISCGV
jgi:hypothetical protein